MKKLLLSIALIGSATLAGSAKELTFQYEGNNLENGATVIYNEMEILDDIPGYALVMIEPNIFIVSDVDANNVSVRATANESIGLCAGGKCENGTDVTKSPVTLAANVPLNIQLDAQLEFTDGAPVVVPFYQVTVEAWYNDDPDNKVTLNVQMGDIAGVESIAAGQNIVNINGKNLNYDVTGNSHITVYSLSGKTLVNKNVAGSGSISLGNLPKGVYVYRVKGKTSKSGKFIIR